MFISANVTYQIKIANFLSLLKNFNSSKAIQIRSLKDLQQCLSIINSLFIFTQLTMLIAQSLSKKYGNLEVLRNVSLKVNKGEIVSIIGPSGAGKSTLLHILSGLDQPDTGTVLISNTNLYDLSSSKQAVFRNKQLGFVFQFHHLLPEFSAIENVAVPLWISGATKKQGLAKAKELLSIVGLQNRMDNKPSEMSGGEQQRVAIARALINEPAILMADEPTGNLDSQNAQAIHELFLSLRDQLNQTIIMITHNDDLAAMTDRTLMMKDGCIVDEVSNNNQK